MRGKERREGEEKEKRKVAYSMEPEENRGSKYLLQSTQQIKIELCVRILASSFQKDNFKLQEIHHRENKSFLILWPHQVPQGT